jgi:hypothetical protein
VLTNDEGVTPWTGICSGTGERGRLRGGGFDVIGGDV